MNEITSEQFSEWEAYDRLDPIGKWREDFRLAYLCSMVTNLVISVHGKKGTKMTSPIDFMLDWDMTKIQEENKVFATENEELKAFKASEDAKAFQFAIESTLKEIESTVEMPKNEIEALRESAKGFSLETIDAWKNSAKAKAFSFSSKKVEKDEKVKGAGLPWIRETTSATGSLWKR
jgi:hypothetical protein